MVKSRTVANRKDLANFLNNSAFPVNQTPSVQDKNKAILESFSTNFSGLPDPTISSITPGSTIQIPDNYISEFSKAPSPSYTKYEKAINNSLEKAGGNVDVFAKNWSNLSLEQQEGLGNPGFARVAIGGALNAVSPINALKTGFYGLVKPLGMLASAVNVASNQIKRMHHRGDLDFSWQALKNSANPNYMLSDSWAMMKEFNNNVGFGLTADSPWNSFYDWSDYTRDQNIGQTEDSMLDAWYLSGAETMRWFAKKTNLPFWQDVTASGMISGVGNIFVDPLNSLTLSAKAGSQFVRNIARNADGLRHVATRNLFEKSIRTSLNNLPAGSRPAKADIDRIINDSNLDNVVNIWLGVGVKEGKKVSAAANSGIKMTAKETKNSAESFLNGTAFIGAKLDELTIMVDGKRITVEVSQKAVDELQETMEITARLLARGESSISSFQKESLARNLNRLGVNEQMETAAMFNARQAANKAAGMPTPNEVFQPLISGIDLGKGEFNTVLSFKYPGTGIPSMFTMNRAAGLLKKVDEKLVGTKASGLTANVSKWDNLKEPIGIAVLNGDTVIKDGLLRALPYAARNVFYGTEKSGRRLQRIRMSGKGHDLKNIIADAASTPNQVISAKATLRALSRGSAKGKSATATLAKRYRIWENDVLPLMKEHLLKVLRSSGSEFGKEVSEGADNILKLGDDDQLEALGQMLKRAVDGEQAAIDIVGAEAVALTKQVFSSEGDGFLAIAHRMAGQEFVSEIDDWTSRVLTKEAREQLIEKSNKKGMKPSPKLGEAGFEKKRSIVSPKEYKKNLTKFVKNKYGKSLNGLKPKERLRIEKEYAALDNATSSKYMGRQLLDVNEPGYNGVAEALAPSIQQQLDDIANQMQLDYKLFDDNIFTSTQSYVKSLGKRTGDAFAETLMLDADVLVSTDGWIMSMEFPSAATATAVRKVRKAVKVRDKLRNDVTENLVNQQRATGKELGDLELELRNLLDVYDAAVAKEKQLLSEYLVMQKASVDNETFIGQRIQEMDDYLAAKSAVEKEIDELALTGSDTTGNSYKDELQKVVSLQKEVNELNRKIARLNIGENAAKGYDDGLYVSYYNDAINSASFAWWLERNIVGEFGDIESARRFFNWSSTEYNVRYNELLYKFENVDWDSTSLGDDLRDAIGAIGDADEAYDFIFDYIARAKDLGTDGVDIFKVFDDAGPEIKFQIERDIAELRFVDPETNKVYPASRGRDFFNELQSAVDNDSVGEWLIYQDMDRFLPGALDNFNGSVKGVFAALDLAQSISQTAIVKLEKIIDEAATLNIKLPASLKRKQVPSKKNYAKAIEIIESVDSNSRLSIAQGNNYSKEAYDNAVRLVVSFENKAPLLNINKIDDLRKVELDYAKALLERRMEFENTIGASPIAEMQFRIPNPFTAAGETIGLAQYVNMKEVSAAYKAGLENGSTFRSVSSRPIDVIKNSGVNIFEDTEGLYQPLIEAYGLDRMLQDALAEGRTVDFYYHSDGKVFQVEESAWRSVEDGFDPVANEPIANALYRELGIPVKNSNVEFVYDDVLEVWSPNLVTEFDPNSQFVSVDSDLVFNGGTALDMDGQARFLDDFSLSSIADGIDPSSGNYVLYDANSQIGQGSMADLLLGNFGVMDQGSLFINNQGQLVRGYNRNSFGFNADGTFNVHTPDSLEPFVRNGFQESDNRFEIAIQQRAEPEDVMLKTQSTINKNGGGGGLSDVVEQGGDLSNRLVGGSNAAQVNTFDANAAVDMSKAKIRKVLEVLGFDSPNTGQSFRKDFEDSIAEAVKKGNPNAQAKIEKALSEFGEAHSKLKPTNRPQRLATDAMIAVGELRFEDAVKILRELQTIVDEGPEALTKAFDDSLSVGSSFPSAYGENIIEGYRKSLDTNGVNFSQATIDQVDQILALRSKYGSWENFVLQHGGRLGKVNPDQVKHITDFLNARTEELARMSDLPFFPENSDDLLRSHLARLNIDSEIINSAADRTELIYLAHSKGNKLMANGGSYGDHTIDAATYSGVAERQAWVTGNGVNLTLSPVAYGQNSADQYTNFVLDLTGGGSVKIYGQDPWRQEAAKQALIRMGANAEGNEISLNEYLTSMEALANQRNTPYGFLPAYLENSALPLHHPFYSFDAASAATSFDDGLGDIQIDMLSRINVETLEDLVNIVDPRVRGELPSFPRPDDSGVLRTARDADLVDPYHDFYFAKNDNEIRLEWEAFNKAEYEATYEGAKESFDVAKELDLASGMLPSRPSGAMDLGGFGSNASYLDPFQASTSAVKETLAIINTSKFAKLFNARGVGDPLFKQVLEFVGWREMISKANPRILDQIGYRTNLDDDQMLLRVLSPGDDLENQISKYFWATNPEFNPDTYALQQAIANRGAARHADTIFNGVYGRIQSNALGNAGNKVYDWQTAGKAAVARGSKGSKEEALVSRVFDEYHLSLAADGYGGTAFHSTVDEVPWSGYKDGLVPGDGVLPQKFSPINKGYMNIVATNPLTLRSPAQIGKIASASSIDEVLEGGIVDVPRYLDFFESEAKAILDKTSPALKLNEDVLERGVQNQINGFQNYKQIRERYVNLFDRINVLEKQIASDIPDKVQLIKAIKAETTYRAEQLEEGLAVLARVEVNFSGTEDATGSGIRASNKRFLSDAEQLSNQLKMLAIRDVDQIEELLSVADAKSLEDAFDQLNKAASVLEIKGDLPKILSAKQRVRYRNHEDIIEATIQAGMRPVGTRSQGTDEIVEGILSWDNYKNSSNKFVQKFDQAHNLVKGYLLMSPGFFARNFYGGVFMNYMAEVSTDMYPAFYKALIVQSAQEADSTTVAGQALIAHAGGFLDDVPVEHISYVRMLKDEGAFGQGQAGIEFETNQFVKGRKAKVLGKEINFDKINVYNPASSNNVVLKFNRDFNVKVETILRGTLGLDRLIKTGGDMTAAFDDIYKYHFDYDDLSAFERGIVKRGFSFYTWQRNAIPLMIKGFAKNPKVFSNYMKGRKALASDKQKDWDKLPDWQRQIGYAPVVGTDGALTFNPDVPPKALLEMASQLSEGRNEGLAGIGTSLMNFTMSMANPLLKAPAEVVSQKNFWKDQQFSGRQVQVSKYYNWLMPIVAATGYGKSVYNPDSKTWSMEDSSYNGMIQMIPPLTQLRRLFPDEPQKQRSALNAWISYLSGTGFRTNNQLDQDISALTKLGQAGDVVDSVNQYNRLQQTILLNQGQ